MNDRLNLEEVQILLVLAETMAKLEGVTGSDELTDICKSHFREYKLPEPAKNVAE